MTKPKTAPKPRNPEARALASPLFRRRVVPSGKAYSRKGRCGAHRSPAEGA